jgi:hypothetical protein
MHYLYSFIAFDIANERAREAADRALARERLVGVAERPSIVRRSLALGLAAISRGSAAATRRLDDVVADDLGRSLTMTH